MYDFKTVCGIDTLYFFYITTDKYENLFQDIIEQIDTQHNFFKESKITYDNNDIKIKIESSTFEYLAKSQGFYWFREPNHLFKFGIKDSHTNRNLHDIQMQYEANGIYSVGLKGLIRFTDNLFKNYTTGEKPITRADLNIFAQYDMSFITKDVFVTRKRLFVSHFEEIQTKHALQTLYVGKKPFRLRLYDKREELKKSKKQELMKEYLANHDIDIHSPLFNIEFEMMRDYLKSFKIDSVEELLENSESLFKEAMDAIRMVDLDGFTDNTNNGNNRNRAKTHPLWEYLKSNYMLDSFLQTDLPLERVKRKTYVYSFEDAISEHIILAKKCATHQVYINLEFYKEVLDNVNYPKKPVNDFAIFKHTMDNEVIYRDVSKLSNFELKAYARSLESDMNNPDRNLEQTMKHYGITLNELDVRGFPKSFPF